MAARHRGPQDAARRTWSACGCTHAGETAKPSHIRHQDVAPLVARCSTPEKPGGVCVASGPHGASYAAIFVDPKPQRQPAAHGRLPALPRRALRGRNPRPRDSARSEGPVAIRTGVRRRPACGGPASPATRSIARAHRSPPGGMGAIMEGGDTRKARRPVPWPSTTGGPAARRSRPAAPCRHVRRRTRREDESDRRQALCYQCHAPRAGSQVHSQGDDRTPTGVHEGARVAQPATRSTARPRRPPAPRAIPACPTAGSTWKPWTPPSSPPRARTTFISSNVSIATPKGFRRRKRQAHQLGSVSRQTGLLRLQQD